MQNSISEIEQLKMENEWLKLQLEAANRDNCYFVKSAMADKQFTMQLLKTLTEQQKFISKIVSVNGCQLGFNDFAGKVYHNLYQN